MAGNTIGKIFQLTSFGESHGKVIGGVIDGMPSKFKIDVSLIQKELDRRRPQGHLWETTRSEADFVEFLSGLVDDRTSGTPIAFLIKNQEQQSKDYDHLKEAFRPSHADYSYSQKYGIKDHRGGGRSSARETAVRVVAGAIAKQFLQTKGISISSYTKQIGDFSLDDKSNINLELIDKSPVRCPNPALSDLIVTELKHIKSLGDTLGGVIHCSIKGVLAGFGEPVFDKLHADLGKAMLSINAVKGVEFGSGFAAVSMKGSVHNDLFVIEDQQIKTKTNHSGGIQGGISNGEEIYLNVAFKPISSIMMEQKSIDSSKREVIIPPKGRHDVCVVPRAGVIVESMAAIIMMDHYLRNQLYNRL